MITGKLLKGECENIRHEKTEWGFSWMQQPTLLLKKKWVTKPKTFLFISSVILKPNSKLHHYNMSELVVKLKPKFTIWIMIQFPAFYTSSQIGLICIKGYNSWIQLKCFSVTQSFNINHVVSRHIRQWFHNNDVLNNCNVRLWTEWHKIHE
jgi:hypothetical protein